ncbi:MAG: transglycosylase SLT domain-containing protein [Bacteroidaceae bacterium]|nr:transglycosylase SLT domain-containing protein [Bacteroidaceae bacterium]MBR5860450.1 transglycosylase SLT domain-containing protein [Bacteroidaceae bacterium]
MKTRYVYPPLLLSLLAFFIVGGDRLFGYTPPEPVEVEIVEPEYEYLSPHVWISHYDEHFRQAADSLELDWMLIAAIAHTESRFDSAAVSSVGAKGVMQMMPSTLNGLDVPDSLHADNSANIHASARYLKSLYRRFRRVKYADERVNFVLASYNAGYGHILDAMRLAHKHGYDRHRWTGHVDTFLIKKSIPEYFNDSVCRNGEFKDWRQTLSFVNKVQRSWKRFNRMQQEYADSVHQVITTDTLKRIGYPLKKDSVI